MKRRNFIKGGVVAGGVAPGLLQSGCAHLPGAGADDLPLPDPAFVEDVLRSFDERLAWIDQQALPASLTSGTAVALTPGLAAKAEQLDPLFRSSLRTLYLVGRFLDLPDEVKVHPGMQERLWAAQPEMDAAVLGVTELLEGLTPEDLAGIKQVLASRPEVGEELAKLLEDPAREDGLPWKRRVSLRSSIIELGARMGAQAPELVIAPYVARVRKLERQGENAEGDARRFGHRLEPEARREREEQLARTARAWERRLAQSPPAAPVTAQPTPPPPATGQPTPPRPTSTAPAAKPETSGRRTLSVGGKVMGLGALTTITGALFAGLHQLTGSQALASIALVLGVTVGPILLVIGLFIVIVAAIMVASE